MVQERGGGGQEKRRPGEESRELFSCTKAKLSPSPVLVKRDAFQRKTSCFGKSLCPDCRQRSKGKSFGLLCCKLSCWFTQFHELTRKHIVTAIKRKEKNILIMFLKTVWYLPLTCSLLCCLGLSLYSCRSNTSAYIWPWTSAQFSHHSLIYKQKIRGPWTAPYGMPIM